MSPADLLNNLGNPVRLQIMGLLSSEGSLCVNDVTDRLGGLQSNISRHLLILRDAGAVEVDKDKTKRVYRVKPKALQLVEMAKEAVEA
ncbi:MULTISPECIES: metalloregulator ArsR/SmtB family transcription factor [unclassified Pseudomonas]|uniref:ArsR/SmtB family transcription factor n=1 Tax=unclassified Pseudomonas TaxID=196821 RepID=UPI00244742B4|nr:MULTISPECIES: metalloregulator ArsR/SmtB family transcription factor [unclassified Pseudomonas]MDG9928770.1 metalloregulator ArsR/SmtB family transcription factor [Pseudomonas sp. GD04042]MDH0481839.1 metalloregulator ArsR/SmtB family transcription factor [Pseudomonas sp. GD04015]MDH0603211.1 metalloregulator ArsR/SmtB family transcription factor [Pseudomonas sp. GD03869]